MQWLVLAALPRLVVSEQDRDSVRQSRPAVATSVAPDSMSTRDPAGIRTATRVPLVTSLTMRVGPSLVQWGDHTDPPGSVREALGGVARSAPLRPGWSPPIGHIQRRVDPERLQGVHQFRASRLDRVEHRRA